MRSKSTLLRVPGGTIEVTNLQKVLFPAAGFTKAQLIDYYVRVAPVLLPHFERRPVALKRYPDGVGHDSYWEKDAPSYTPDWVRTTPVWRRSGESQIHYILVSDIRTLAWCAQIASIELHPFLHRAPRIDRPTSVVFDLDPGPGTDILTCADVAFWLRDALGALGLTSCVKVSGSKGLQVYCPLNTPTTYGKTQPFAHALARRLERDHPHLIVSTMAKAVRAGRILIDWSQNAAHKTTVGAYSVRAKREQPFVSMPVTWNELAAARRRKDPERLSWTPEAALARIEKTGDLFAPVLSTKQKLPALEDANGASRPRATRQRSLASPGSSRP